MVQSHLICQLIKQLIKHQQIHHIMRAIHLNLLLLTILLITVHAQGWSPIGGIRTGRFVIVPPASILTATAPISYNITYSSAISATLSCGLGIVGFNTSLTNYFSVNVSITNFITTTMSVTAVALDDTIMTYLAINYIAVGANIDFLDIQTACFLPSVINQNNGTRSQTRSGATFFVNQAVQCQVVLSGFRIFNSVGLINNFGASVDCANTNGFVTTTFTATENNTVSLVCYTTIVFCDACTKITYSRWGLTGRGVLSPTNLPSATIPIPTSPNFVGNDRGFWGISALSFSRGTGRNFNLQTDYFNTGGATFDLNYPSSGNPGYYNATVSYFFIARRSCNSTHTWFTIDPTTGALSCQVACPPNTYATIPGLVQYCAGCHYTCTTCDAALSTNCTGCNATEYRTLTTLTPNTLNSCTCNAGYVDVNVSLCARCQDYIPGCYTCLSTSICTLCYNGFYILAGTCQCTTGYLVTGVCTSIYGCTSATNLGGTIHCLACNATLYYQYVASSHTCVCITGYYADIHGNCLGKCGDSILAYGQQCDDGNIISGDGCSSTCQIQANTTCINNPMPSNCVWNYNISTSVAYVKRIMDNNAVEIALKLQPPNTFYKTLNWAINVMTDLPCLNGADIYHNGEYLIINCIYSQALEGNTYNFTLQMDNYYYLNNSYLYATIPALGMNAKLTYDSNYGMNNIQNVLVIVVSVYAVVLMFVSTISQRMIGVECIQTFQTVLYAMTVMYISPSSIAPLQNLKYSTGYNSLYGINHQRLYKIDFVIGEVGLQNQFLVSFNLSYIILAVIIFSALLLKSIMLKFQNDKKKEQQQYNRTFDMEDIHPNYPNVKKAYKIIFERIFFVAGFWCMFLVLFATVIQYTMPASLNFLAPSKMNGFLSILAVVVIVGFLAMVIVNGLYPRLRIFPMFMNQRYPVYYTLYNLLYISLIIAFYKQEAIPFILAGLSLINLIVLAIWRPYPQNFHNAIIVFEQVTIIIAIGIYIYQNFTAPQENNQSLFTIGFFGIWFLLLAVDILSTIRLYKYWRYMKDNKLTYDDAQDVQKDQEKALVTPNAKEKNELNQTAKGFDDKGKGNKTMNTGISSMFKPYQDNYSDGIKQNGKNPLNYQPETKRFDNSRIQPNKIEQDYQTFSKKKSYLRNQSNNNFSINPIDPNPQEISRTDKKSPSPYDQYGNIKIHNKVEGQEEYDALKAIKARLRKDFYQKVHGVEFAGTNQQKKAENSISNQPQNFEPSDRNDQD